jgi:hypothetical protein
VIDYLGIDYLGIEYLGWIATVVFVASYFCKTPGALRSMQMAGALLWVTYGILIAAPPVVAANVLVLLAAAWTARRSASRVSVASAASVEAGRVEPAA